MNTVEPIRDINTVWDIADYLGEKSERNKIMFLFGIYVGIRVSDILRVAAYRNAYHEEDVRISFLPADA